MKTAPSLSLVLAMVVLATSPLLSQEEKGKKRNANVIPRQLKEIENKLASLDLKDDQKKKVDDILASYKTKFADAQAKAPKLTKEQRQTQKEATEKARAEGKKGKELQAAVGAALNLTDEQKKAREAAVAASKSLMESLKKDLSGVLTAEQAKVLSPGKPNKKKKAA